MVLIDGDTLFRKMEEAEWYNNADRDEIAETLVLNAPTIEERKKGKWIREGSAFNLRCPYCRKFFVEPIGSKFNFCPNCGMRGTP